eukprot:7039840-Prymnesium_polylepis.1
MISEYQVLVGIGAIRGTTALCWDATRCEDSSPVLSSSWQEMPRHIDVMNDEPDDEEQETVDAHLVTSIPAEMGAQQPTQKIMGAALTAVRVHRSKSEPARGSMRYDTDEPADALRPPANSDTELGPLAAAEADGSVDVATMPNRYDSELEAEVATWAGGRKGGRPVRRPSPLPHVRGLAADDRGEAGHRTRGG